MIKENLIISNFVLGRVNGLTPLGDGNHTPDGATVRVTPVLMALPH